MYADALERAESFVYYLYLKCVELYGTECIVEFVRWRFRLRENFCLEIYRVVEFR